MSNELKYKSITETMCQALRALHCKYKASDVSLVVEKGRGKRTYYRNATAYNPYKNSIEKSRNIDEGFDLRYANASKHKIILGWKMVQSKSQSKVSLIAWRTAKEIQERKYFGGDLDLRKLLAHVILHEYAHFIAALLRPRQKGEVHGDFFYTQLDKLYEDGMHEFVLELLMENKLFRELEFEQEEQDLNIQEASQKELQIGNKVSFVYKNETIVGNIIKLNKKTASVSVDNDSFARFNVPYHLLKLEDGTIRPIQKPVYNTRKYSVGQKIKFEGRSGIMEGIVRNVNLKTLSVNVEGISGYYRVPYPLIRD